MGIHRAEIGTRDYVLRLRLQHGLVGVDRTCQVTRLMQLYSPRKLRFRTLCEQPDREEKQAPQKPAKHSSNYRPRDKFNKKGWPIEPPLVRIVNVAPLKVEHHRELHQPVPALQRRASETLKAVRVRHAVIEINR